MFGLIGNGSSAKLYRISGFTFTVTGDVVWSCTAGGCNGTITQFRFDHNTVNGTGGTGQTIIQIGEATAQQYVYGVLDHNAVTCSNSCYFMQWQNHDAAGGYDPSPPPPPMGTINNLFIEDNTITISSLTDNGTGCIDHWGSSAVVFRYNTVANCRVISHGVDHGGGPSNFEIYNNSITMNANATNELDCYRCVHDQGANTLQVFNNILHPYSGKSSAAMEFLHYRDWQTGTLCDGTNGGGYPDGNRSPTSTWHGYPCFRQPGRDVTGAYKPIYSWNDQWSDGTLLNLDFGDPGGSPDYTAYHVVQNREYYVAVSVSPNTSPTSPFDGTTGMGFGTLANRPTTCTTSSETAYGNGAAGVGYAVETTAGTIGASTAEGTPTDAVLYTCSATNTWKVYYTPYAYPHPLITGSVTKPVAPPTGLAATVR